MRDCAWRLSLVWGGGDFACAPQRAVGRGVMPVTIDHRRDVTTTNDEEYERTIQKEGKEMAVRNKMMGADERCAQSLAEQTETYRTSLRQLLNRLPQPLAPLDEKSREAGTAYERANEHFKVVSARKDDATKAAQAAQVRLDEARRALDKVHSDHDPGIIELEDALARLIALKDAAERAALANLEICSKAFAVSKQELEVALADRAAAAMKFQEAARVLREMQAVAPSATAAAPTPPTAPVQPLLATPSPPKTLKRYDVDADVAACIAFCRKRQLRAHLPGYSDATIEAFVASERSDVQRRSVVTPILTTTALTMSGLGGPGPHAGGHPDHQPPSRDSSRRDRYESSRHEDHGDEGRRACGDFDDRSGLSCGRTAYHIGRYEASRDEHHGDESKRGCGDFGNRSGDSYRQAAYRKRYGTDVGAHAFGGTKFYGSKSVTPSVCFAAPQASPSVPLTPPPLPVESLCIPRL